MAKKSPNFCVVACCSGCHDVLDRRAKYPLTGSIITEDEAAWYWLRGMQRQVKSWLDEGVLRENT